jgi:hypothetical protein
MSHLLACYLAEGVFA